MESDLRDILDLDKANTSGQTPTKESVKYQKETKRPKKEASFAKKPSGMKRELYALLCTDVGPGATSIVPTDTGSGYRQPKARLGRNRVRAWKWMPFTNSARMDQLVLYHWRRGGNEGIDYPFSKFNKTMSFLSYTEEDYKKYLSEDDWTKEETDRLFDLCQQFDLRFPVVWDRYNAWAVKSRSVEDLKERYYSVCNRIRKVRCTDQDNMESELVAYDGDHEKRRKEQLERLYMRTKEQVEEEEMLITELKKIELRKKEREKKQQDLQKLISQADQSSEARKTIKKTPISKFKKVPVTQQKQIPETNPGVFKSYDKSSGVTLRGNKMKMPVTIGQKKAKLIEQLLEEMSVDLHPMPTENICVQFNELRNDILLLLDLKAGCDACDFEYQSLKHQYEALPPEKQAKISLPEISSSPKKQVSAFLPVMEVPPLSNQSRKRRPLGAETPHKKKKA